MSKLLDLAGQRFDMLTAIRPSAAPSSNNGKNWHCVCDCGTELLMSSMSLRKPGKHSCGCVDGTNLVGQRFGRLVVTKPAPIKPGGISKRWLCVCDCGSQHVATSVNLRSGGTSSCGCLRRELARTRLRAPRVGG